MQETKEINALFTLIDDPDEEVYSTISERIVGYGKGIIPNLEHLWENTPSEDIQSRIEMIIHRLHYKDLLQEIKEWGDGPYHDLLSGTLLVSKYQYPDLLITNIMQDLEKIRRNIWLELNSFLTPLEQANVLSSILYNYYNLKGTEVNHDKPDEFFIHKVLETKKGNAVSNGLIYQILCEQLDIHARIIHIPRHCILAFYHSDYDPSISQEHPQERIHFFVDGGSGQAYSHADIENYFKRINIEPTPDHFKPISHKKLVRYLLEELSKCFSKPDNQYKQEELLQLAQLLLED